jgi:hypothetical protein
LKLSSYYPYKLCGAKINNRQLKTIQSQKLIQPQDKKEKNGFEDRELMYPYYRFQEADYKVDVAIPKAKVTYNSEHELTMESNLSPKTLTSTIM